MEDYINSIKKKFTIKEIERTLSIFSNLNVLVIGDTIIDEYSFVTPKGRAIKDPILSTGFRHKEVYAGGILAIANHVSSFVNKVKVLTLLGDHETKEEMIEEYLSPNVDPQFFKKDNSPTTVKRRYIDHYRNSKMFKVEFINERPISESLTTNILNFLDENASQFDLVIVADFGHGFINDQIRRKIEEKSNFLALNVQTNSANLGYNYFNQYQRADFLTVNEDELHLPIGKRFKNAEDVVSEVTNRFNFNKILVTKGKNGCSYFQDGKSFSAPILTQSVRDTVGAGDTLFAISSLAVYSKVNPELIPFLANVAGGIAANIMGNKESVNIKVFSKFISELYKIEIRQYLTSVNETLSKTDTDSIDSLIRLLLEAYHKENTIYVFGNGGSAATASHFCGDLVKGVSYGLTKRFRVHCLNDNLPALMAIANDCSYDDIFVEQLKNFLRKGDIVIGISGSGNSLNVVKALEYAKENGAKTVAICGYKGGKIKDIAELSIHSEIEDMEISEDIHHLILSHCIKRILTKELGNDQVGDVYAKRIQG